MTCRRVVGVNARTRPSIGLGRGTDKAEAKHFTAHHSKLCVSVYFIFIQLFLEILFPFYFTSHMNNLQFMRTVPVFLLYPSLLPRSANANHHHLKLSLILLLYFLSFYIQLRWSSYLYQSPCHRQQFSKCGLGVESSDCRENKTATRGF